MSPELEDILHCVVSLSFVLVLFGKWVLQPQWRSTVTYIGLCQVTVGAVYIVFPIIRFSIRYNYEDEYFNVLLRVTYFIRDHGFQYFLCWFFVAPLAVYKELAKIDKPMKNRKMVATALSLAIFGIVEAVTYGSEYLFRYSSYWIEELLMVILIGSVIVLHVVVIVKVSCCTELAKRDQDHAMRVVKCELLTLVLLATMVFLIIQRYIYLYINTNICIALVPLVAALILHKPAHSGLEFTLPVTMKNCDANTDDIENPKPVRDDM